MAVKRQPAPLVIAALAVLLAVLPLAGLPDYYLSFLYLVFFWVSLSTSWGIVSGTTGYWSFGARCVLRGGRLHDRDTIG